MTTLNEDIYVFIGYSHLGNYKEKISEWVLRGMGLAEM